MTRPSISDGWKLDEKPELPALNLLTYSSLLPERNDTVPRQTHRTVAEIRARGVVYFLDVTELAIDLAMEHRVYVDEPKRVSFAIVSPSVNNYPANPS